MAIPSPSSLSVERGGPASLAALLDVLSSLGFDALVLADLLECKATNSGNSSLTDPLYFAAGQFRAFQRRLEAAEQAATSGFALGRGGLTGGAQ